MKDVRDILVDDPWEITTGGIYKYIPASVGNQVWYYVMAETHQRYRKDLEEWAEEYVDNS